MMKTTMSNICVKYCVLALVFGFSGMVVADESDENSMADQMVCHVTKINHAMDSTYNSKNIYKCIKRSTKDTQGYNNLADIYADGWLVETINNDNIWLFSK